MQEGYALYSPNAEEQCTVLPHVQEKIALCCPCMHVQYVWLPHVLGGNALCYKYAGGQCTVITPVSRREMHWLHLVLGKCIVLPKCRRAMHCVATVYTGERCTVLPVSAEERCTVLSLCDALIASCAGRKCIVLPKCRRSCIVLPLCAGEQCTALPLFAGERCTVVPLCAGDPFTVLPLSAGQRCTVLPLCAEVQCTELPLWCRRAMH
jgi:hypothetical protein